MVFPLHAITTAPMAWQYVRQHGHPVPALEPLFAEDPYNAYDYALLYKKNAFQLGEDAISRHPRLAYWYARDVIRRPFLPGEAAIARDSLFAFSYARDVLREPFVLGEPKIWESLATAYDYDRWLQSMGKTMANLQSLCLSGCILGYYYHIQECRLPLLERIHQLQHASHTPPIAAHEVQQVMALYQGFVQQMAWADQIQWLQTWCTALSSPIIAQTTPESIGPEVLLQSHLF